MSGNIISVKRKVLPIHDKDEDSTQSQHQSQHQHQLQLQTYNQLKKEIKSTQTEDLPLTVKENVACIDYDLITSRIIAGLEGQIALLITNLSRINVYPSVTDLLETSSEPFDISDEPAVQAQVQVISDEPAAQVQAQVQVISDEAVQAQAQAQVQVISDEPAVQVQVISDEAVQVQVQVISAEAVQAQAQAQAQVQVISDEAVQVEVQVQAQAQVISDEAVQDQDQVISDEAVQVQVQVQVQAQAQVKVLSDEASSTKVGPKSQGELYNEYFHATMILDITGTGTGLSEAHNQHINNCFLLSPELPDNCTQSKRILYYLHSAIELAKEHNYERVNIITNHLRIYKNFMDVISIAIPLLMNKDWKLVHYCCNNVSYPYQAVDLDKFDAATYCTLNNDLPDIVKGNKARSIQDWCARGHKIGRFANVSLLESTSSNTLAFGISSSEYDNLLLALEREIELPHSDGQHIFDNVTDKFMLAPNLFMVPGTGASIMKQLRWLPQLYLEV
jgi:hypothetical protein